MKSTPELRHSVRTREMIFTLLIFLSGLALLAGYATYAMRQNPALPVSLQQGTWLGVLLLGLLASVLTWRMWMRAFHPMAQLELLRSEILVLLATDTALPQVLMALVQGIRRIRPDLRCAVLALEPRSDAQGACFRVSASVGLPDFFVTALDGLHVTAGNGGCATAGFTGERVVIENVPEHSYWVQYRALAAQAKIGACWSEPVLGADKQVFAVFSIYKETPQTPPIDDLELIEQVSRLASIAFERDLAAKQLRASAARFRTLAENTPEGIVVHRDKRILYANPAAVRLFGAISENDLMRFSTDALIHPDFLNQQAQRLRAIEQAQTIEPMVESRFLRLDGTAFDVEVQGTSIMFADQKAVHVSIRDVTQRKQNEQQLLVAANVFSHALEGILITSPDASIIDVNAAFTRITGYSRAEVLGENPRLLKSGRQEQVFYQTMWRELLEQGQWSGEVWNRRKDGRLYVQMQHINAVHNAQGQVIQYVSLFSDITQRKENEVRLAQLAHFDDLTGLPNRLLQRDRLHQAMVQAVRRAQKLAVAFLDLDGFKPVNDTYGHEAGDHVLITLAQRMKSVLREGDTLARIGGDEFAALLVDLDQQSDCELLLQRLLEAVAEPIAFGEHKLQLSVSIGVALYPQVQDISLDQLMHQADMAMYRAKEAGKNRYSLHHERVAPVS